ncbi:MAG: hypothetical protein ACLFQ0_07465 [Cyclobacteriaceae bacterium]
MTNELSWSGKPHQDCEDVGFFQIAEDKISFQRDYCDKLSFFRQHSLPLPTGSYIKQQRKY